MLKIGLEKEFFVKRNNQYIVVPKELPYDESGLLAEARGCPCDCPISAVFSLKAQEYKLKTQAEGIGVVLLSDSIANIPKNIKIEASRKFFKGLTKYENLYGYQSHKNRISESTAGIHISFTNSCDILLEDNKSVRTYNGMFDWVKIFRQLDYEFKEEIKNSKRLPGFYELKPDGRIEYRSLPSNTDLDKIIEVLVKILKI